MFKIIGQVVNFFTVEGGTDKEGKEYEPSSKVQMMGLISLENGDTKMDLIDLKVTDLSEWQDLKGKRVSIDVGQYSPSKGTIINFVRKGAKPELLA